MVICKYFLQGTCRFGNNCKFEHQINTDHHNYASSTSPLLQYTNKPAQSTTTTTTNVDTNTLVKSVVNDMNSAEKGGQWLLSSYAPFKEKPAFPGFEDHSMEEIRYLFYESMKNGTVEQFKRNLQMMLQQAVMKIKALQNPSPDAVNMLKTIYNTPPSSSFGNNQTPFNSTQTNSVFGNSQPQQNTVFGGATANQNIFGGSTTPSNIFGANQQPAQSSVFGGNSGTSIFGGGQNSNTIFAQQQQVSPNKSIFGNSPPQSNSNSIFGGNSMFGSGAQTVFNSQPQAALPFTQSTPFAQPSQQQMTFTAAQQNIFQQNRNNQLGGLQNPQFPASQPTLTPGENKTSFQHTSNIFGNLGVQANNPIFAASQSQIKPNEEFYSKLEELNEEEIKWFQSDDLDVSKIPEKPPTYEMCFKV